MTTISELLQAILHLIRIGCNAEAVSLFILVPTAEGDYPLLIHDGENPAVPELTDLETAERFTSSITSRKNVWDMLVSRDPDGRLMSVPSLVSLLEGYDDNPILQERRKHTQTVCPGVLVDPGMPAWIGIRGGEPVNPETLLNILRDGEHTSLQLAFGSLIGCRTQMVCTAEMDPISQLPSRSAYRISYRRIAEGGSADSMPGLILVNPDDFIAVNDRFNREIGDKVIREIAQRLSSSVRNSDFVFRYGAAMFGVLLPNINVEKIQMRAEKMRVRLASEPYLDGSVSLSFSLGGAVADFRKSKDNADGAIELARRADAALSAEKRSGGKGFELWTEKVGTEEADRLDSLSGIFTAEPARDYRNMRLLWDTVRMIATNTDVDEIKNGLLHEVISVFRLTAAGVYDEGQSEGAWKILRRVNNANDDEWTESSEEDSDLARIRQQVMTDGKTVAQTNQDANVFRCMIPLPSGSRILGCMFLEGNVSLFRLNSSDLIFFEALAEQIAMALDRSRLTAMELRQHEQAHHKLQQELDELQKSIKRSSLVYRSETMEQLLRTAKRLASTDTTVLIYGESGTGKEVLARTIHELSMRSKKPLVVVDCSTITTSLIDSELFGHERGAFTGADRRSDGRLLEADGGTVLLDEIGELPLEVQSKLLRFVQDKQFTPVGSNQVKTVDVRVLALTNRDLAAEAKAGRFREDLYHRLNVMRLVVPALRDRTEDIEYLAIHFIKTFAVQYNRQVTGLTPAGREAILEHHWSGNVRELQNRIMRAVVLAESDMIGPGELELLDQPPSDSHVSRPADAPSPPPQEPVQAENAWEDLRQSLSEAIDRITAGEKVHPPPLGKWVHEDMVMEASRVTGDITSRAAGLLGIPETTFRRKLRAASGNVAVGISNRPPEWEEIRGRIARLLESGNPDREDLLDLARLCILEELAGKIPGDNRTGAAVMGVTETTFKKWSRGNKAAGGVGHE